MNDSDFSSLPFAIAMLLQGIAALLLNILMILAVVTSASNRVRKEYAAIVGVGVAEALLAIAFLLMSVNWIIQLCSDYVPLANRESFQCLTVHYNILFAISYQFVGFSTLIVAVDRFLAAFLPKLYAKLSITDIGIAFVVSFLLSLVPLIAALNFSRTARLQYYSNRPFLYMAIDSISDIISPFFVLLRLLVVSASVLLALPVMYFRKDKKLFKTTSKVATISTVSVTPSSIRIHRKSQISVVGFAITTSVVFLIIPDMLTITLEFLQYNVFLSVYLLNQFRSWLNSAVYIVKHPNLRRQIAELRRLLLVKK